MFFFLLYPRERERGAENSTVQHKINEKKIEKDYHYHIHILYFVNFFSGEKKCFLKFVIKHRKKNLFVDDRIIKRH